MSKGKVSKTENSISKEQKNCAIQKDGYKLILWASKTLWKNVTIAVSDDNTPLNTNLSIENEPKIFNSPYVQIFNGDSSFNCIDGNDELSFTTVYYPSHANPDKWYTKVSPQIIITGGKNKKQFDGTVIYSDQSFDIVQI